MNNILKNTSLIKTFLVLLPLLLNLGAPFAHAGEGPCKETKVSPAGVELPSRLLSEIFRKLDVESYRHCKSVSKFWYECEKKTALVRELKRFKEPDCYQYDALRATFSPNGDQILCKFSPHRAGVYTPGTDLKLTEPTILLAPDFSLFKRFQTWVDGGERQFGGYYSVLNQAEYSRDGSKILTGYADSRQILWDAKTGKKLKRGKGADPHGIASSSLSPSGDRVLTDTYYLHRATLWNTETGQAIFQSQDQNNSQLRPSFTASGSLAVVPTEENLLVVDSKSGQVVKRLPSVGEHGHFEISPVGDTIMISDHAGHRWGIYHLETGKKLSEVFVDTNPAAVAFSPDGKEVATGGEEGEVSLWNAETGDLVEKYAQHGNAVKKIAYSPDREKIVSISANAVLVWDREQRKITNRIEYEYLNLRKGFSKTCVFFPKQKKFLVSTLTEIFLISLESGRVLYRFRYPLRKTEPWGTDWQGDRVTSRYDEARLDVSSDGRKLLVTMADGRVVLWNLAMLD